VSCDGETPTGSDRIARVRDRADGRMFEGNPSRNFGADNDNRDCGGHTVHERIVGSRQRASARHDDRWARHGLRGIVLGSG
jgi:hypothetical protein